MTDIRFYSATVWFPNDTYTKDDIEESAKILSDRYPDCIVQVNPDTKLYDEIIKENDNG